MTAPYVLRLKDGHFWCERHRMWWKQCPCPGQVSTIVLVGRETIEACTPKRNAFVAAMEMMR